MTISHFARLFAVSILLSACSATVNGHSCPAGSRNMDCMTAAELEEALTQ